MNGEGKLTLIALCIALVCITILYSFLFLSLWSYREYVGLSLLAVIVVSVAVFLRGRLTEQNVRMLRYRQNEETPIDQNGEPMHWREGYQPNPHRH